MQSSSDLFLAGPAAPSAAAAAAANALLPLPAAQVEGNGAFIDSENKPQFTFPSAHRICGHCRLADIIIREAYRMPHAPEPKKL